MASSSSSSSSLSSSTLSNHGNSPFSALHRSLSQPLKPFRTLSFPFRRNPCCSVAALSSPKPTPRRRPSRPSLRFAAADDTEAINGVEEDQVSANKPENSEGQVDFPPMKVLIQAYKKAIVDGNEKAMIEIEAQISIIENDKNNLTLKSEELAAEIVSGRNKLVRLKADFENFRKRTEKDHLSLTSDVRGEVIESLLPMVDSFEKAKQQLKPETEKEKRIDASYQGIYKQFVEIMRSLQVAVVGTVGKPFDPSIHEAIGREESQKFKAGVVTQEVRRGFLLGDRLLRPATVKVSAGPGPGKVPLATEKKVGVAAEPVEDKTAMPSSS